MFLLRFVCSVAMAGTLLLLDWVPANALPNFLSVTPVAPSALSDVGDEVAVDIATDGNGVWLVVWTTEDPVGGGNSQSPRLVFARSTDGGATWSTPAKLAESAQADTQVAVAYGNGMFVVLWERDSVPMVSRSPDGLTWSAPVAVGASVSINADHGLDIATDGAGTWVAVWASTLDALTAGGMTGSDADLFFARSLDNGATWSAEAPANPDATTDHLGGGSSIDNADDDGPVLASDGAGNWVLLWRRNQVLGKVLAAASPDNGASWGSLAELRSGLGGAGTLAGFTGGRYAALATDRLGTWIADWNDGCAKSIDAGATWTMPLACPFGDLWRLEGAATSGVLLADGNGAWLSAAAYLDPVTLGGSVGSDADILISRSVDGGVTWSHPAALVGTAARGRAWKDVDSDPVLAVDANGQWMAAWISGEPSLSGSDGDPLTGDTDIVVARAVPVCRPDPVANCTTVRAADKQRFKLVARGGNGDRLALALRSKDLIPGDFGDPTGTTDIGLCVYDRVAGITRLVYEINVPASATCGGVPCWAGAAGRFDYIDRTSRHGAVTRVKLRARGGGGGAVTIKGHGPALAPPRIPFIVDPDLTVQVVAADTRTCLEAHFSSPKRNNDETFRAK